MQGWGTQICGWAGSGAEEQTGVGDCLSLEDTHLMAMRDLVSRISCKYMAKLG